MFAPRLTYGQEDLQCHPQVVACKLFSWQIAARHCFSIRAFSKSRMRIAFEVWNILVLTFLCLNPPYRIVSIPRNLCSLAPSPYCSTYFGTVWRILRVKGNRLYSAVALLATDYRSHHLWDFWMKHLDVRPNFPYRSIRVNVDNICLAAPMLDFNLQCRGFLRSPIESMYLEPSKLVSFIEHTVGAHLLRRGLQCEQYDV